MSRFPRLCRRGNNESFPPRSRWKDSLWCFIWHIGWVSRIVVWEKARHLHWERGEVAVRRFIYRTRNSGYILRRQQRLFQDHPSYHLHINYWLKENKQVAPQQKNSLIPWPNTSSWIRNTRMLRSMPHFWGQREMLLLAPFFFFPKTHML